MTDVEHTFSLEAGRVYSEAMDIAVQSGKHLDSSHLVLAVFTVPCEAQSILMEKRLDVDRILDAMPIAESEPHETIGVIYSTAANIAAKLGSKQVTSVHLLMAISRISSCKAARVLEKAGLPLYALRTHAMAHLTEPRLRRAATRKLMNSGFEIMTRAAPRPSLGSAATVPVPRAAESTSSVATEPEGDDVVELRYPGDGMEERAVAEDWGEGSRYALDPSEFPTLVELGRNLTVEAEKGLLDPLIGRGADLDRVVDILCKRRANNPLLLGDPGVGKTALVEGLARFVVERGRDVPALGDKVVVALSVADLLAGTAMRGSFAARLRDLKEEVLRAGRRVILFIDEIHTLIGAGVGDGNLDASNDLKGALSRGEFPCIGATTFGEYQRYIKPDPALNRRFEVVVLREPSQSEADAIIEGVAPVYEKFHGVTFGKDALYAAVRLSDRFISDRSLPAKAIDLMDRAGARAGRNGIRRVGREEIADVLSGLVDLPPAFLTLSPADGLRGLETFMNERVVGHEDAVAEISATLRKNWARFGSRRPMGSFVFAGPPGVGKRSTALALAEFLFGSEKDFLEIDLSDYGESHSLSHLVGSPPGYVGHEEGGLLSDALTRRPFTVINWLNAGVAHPSVQALLAQIVSEGTATDRRGRRMDFRNTVQVVSLDMDTEGPGGAIGFGNRTQGPRDRVGASLLSRCRHVLPGSLVDELDCAIPFGRLVGDHLVELARRMVKKTVEGLGREYLVRLSVSERLMEHLTGLCGVKGRTPSEIEGQVVELLARPAADFIFEEGVKAGSTVRAELDGDGPGGVPLIRFEVEGEKAP